MSGGTAEACGFVAPLTVPSPCDAMLKEAADLLRQAGIERPLFEAQVLLAHVFGMTRGDLLARWPFPFSDAERERWMELVRARAERKPMAYVRGSQEFYGLRMNVNEDVLVPRPETELLVDLALAEAQRLAEPVIVDACTGSGCVAAALAHHLTNAHIVATDVSWEALQTARGNLNVHAATANARLVACSTVRALGPAVADIVTANPPYIASSEIGGLQPEVRDFEPRIALDGGPDGLAVIRELLSEAFRVLRPGGLILMEVAIGQSEEAVELMTRTGYAVVAVHRDLAGIPRAVEARKPGTPVGGAGGPA